MPNRTQSSPRPAGNAPGSPESKNKKVPTTEGEKGENIQRNKYDRDRQGQANDKADVEPDSALEESDRLAENEGTRMTPGVPASGSTK